MAILYINLQEKKLLLERNGAHVARISVFEVCIVLLRSQFHNLFQLGEFHHQLNIHFSLSLFIYSNKTH